MDVGLGSELEVFLAGFRGQRILFAPNPGNAGDAVIACAEYQLFERVGISYQIIPLDVSCEVTAGEVVFYGGGGNLVGFYTNARDFIARHHRGVKRLVVLPHTVVAYPELISEFGVNVDIICREKLSHDYVSRFASAANVHLMDDVVFSLDVKKMLRAVGGAKNTWLRRPRATARNLVREFRHAVRNIKQSNTLNSFRGDVESTGKSREVANVDVSSMFYPDSMSVEDTIVSSCGMINFINKFDVVRTDRLHVCIVSLLLGKEIHFFDNSYGKNRAVYEQSMRGRFPNLKWCE